MRDLMDEAMDEQIEADLFADMTEQEILEVKLKSDKILHRVWITDMMREVFDFTPDHGSDVDTLLAKFVEKTSVEFERNEFMYFLEEFFPQVRIDYKSSAVDGAQPKEETVHD